MPPEDKIVRIRLSINRRSHVSWQHTSDIHTIHLFAAGTTNLELPAGSSIRERGNTQKACLNVLLSLLLGNRHTLIIMRIFTPYLINNIGGLG